jgi:allophanate hydrolase subunit 1
MFFVPVVYGAIGPDMEFTCRINLLSSARHAIETPPLEAGEAVVPGGALGLASDQAAFERH